MSGRRWIAAVAIAVGASAPAAAGPLLALRNDPAKVRLAPAADEGVVVVLIDNSRRFPV